MGRKRKNADDAVARFIRTPAIPHFRDRTISVHTTPSGRLGQSTSSLPSQVDPLMQDDALLQDDRPSAALDQSATTGVGIGWSLADELAVDGDDSMARSEEPGQFEDDLKTSDNSPLREWANLHRATYLDELIRHEGRAGAHNCHRQCGKEGIYRCKDCFGSRTLCRDCFVEQHSHTPLHRPQVRPAFLPPVVALTHSDLLPAMDWRVF